MKRSQRDKAQTVGFALHLAGAVLLISLVGGYYSFVFQRIRSSADRDASRIDLITEFLRESGKVRSAHHRLQQEIDTLQTTGMELRSRLAVDIEPDALSQGVRQLAKMSGLRINQLNMGKSELANSFRQTEFQLQCDGSYASICSFLEGIQQLSWITDITQLQIDAKDLNDEHKLLARFTVYYDLSISDSDKT